MPKDVVNELLELLEKKTLTQEKFEKILFNKKNDDALGYIMRTSNSKRIERLKALIKTHSIKNLRELEEKAETLSCTDLFEQYGLDSNSTKFNPDYENFIIQPKLQELAEQLKKDEPLRESIITLCNLIGRINYIIIYASSKKSDAIALLKRLQFAITIIEEEYTEITKDASFSKPQIAALQVHRERVLHAVCIYADDLLTAESTSDFLFLTAKPTSNLLTLDDSDKAENAYEKYQEKLKSSEQQYKQETDQPQMVFGRLLQQGINIKLGVNIHLLSPSYTVGKSRFYCRSPFF